MTTTTATTNTTTAGVHPVHYVGRPGSAGLCSIFILLARPKGVVDSASNPKEEWKERSALRASERYAEGRRWYATPTGQARRRRRCRAVLAANPFGRGRCLRVRACSVFILLDRPEGVVGRCGRQRESSLEVDPEAEQSLSAGSLA
jgi:hypothetical protein